MQLRLFALGVVMAEGRPRPLPRLNIDLDSISISGLSSGADFASQFQVAFSKTIMGLGVFAGQPYHCAVTQFPADELTPPNPSVPICEGCPANKTLVYDHCKVHPEWVNVTVLAEVARRHADEGLIDDLEHLARAKIYVFSGTADTGHLGATQKTHDFFAQFLPAANLFGNFEVPAGHCWPEDHGLNFCGNLPLVGNPWPSENCGYDGPGAMLQHIYGDLQPRAKTIRRLSLKKFDQSVFNGNDTDAMGLSSEGFIYVPRSCSGGAQCRLHVVLHGCGTPSFVVKELAHHMSYDLWAETNNLVILWPKIEKHGATREQRQGCWDAYGQTGANYDKRDGLQMQAVRKMIETISGADMSRVDSADSHAVYLAV